MHLNSFSLAKEDLFLNERIFKNKKFGTYLELGAVDGVIQSNTKYFEDFYNWSGILIEPNPLMFNKLKANRPNNKLFNSLISCYQQEMDFLIMEHLEPVAAVINTMPNEHYEKFYNNSKYANNNKNIIKIKPDTLTNIINKCDYTHIDLFSLDVEGHELEVLKSYDFNIPIYVILIETLGSDNIKENECHNLLLSKGYKFYMKCAHNSIYVLKNSEYDIN